MKKTSLILAISALLYGTSSSYVLAGDCPLPADMTPTEVNDYLTEVSDFLNSLPDGVADILDPEEGTEDGLPENLNVTLSREPFDKLPKNVFVDSSNPIYKPRMCGTSYQVDGGSMAEFPVTVTTNWGVSAVNWNQLDAVTGYASGDGWLLVQSGDTWYQENPWRLYTCGDTTVEQIVLEPIIDSDGDRRKYAFDIGGLVKPPAVEHTTGTARGRPIEIKAPPRVSFTATYSRPVYVGPDPDLHLGGEGNGEDSSNIVSGHDPKDNIDDDTPTHDLYGVLTIDFSEPVQSAELNPAFRFLADTDCVLPVVSSNAKSYQDGQLTFTLTMSKEGSGYIAERCGVEDPTPIAGPFTVEDGEGTVEFSTALTLQPGCYYSVVNVADDGSMETVPLELEGGATTNENNEYYHAE